MVEDKINLQESLLDFGQGPQNQNVPKMFNEMQSIKSSDLLKKLTNKSIFAIDIEALIMEKRK